MFMHIETTRFGTLDVEERKVLTFPDGLPGFEEHRQFTLVPHHTAEGGKGSPFVWLQSLEDGGLAFLAMEPHQAFPDYAPRVPRAEMEALALLSKEQGEEAARPRSRGTASAARQASARSSRITPASPPASTSRGPGTG